MALLPAGLLDRGGGLGADLGFNLFVVQSLTGRDIFTVAKACLPFFVLMVIATALVTFFPEIVLALPHAMTAR